MPEAVDVPAESDDTALTTQAKDSQMKPASNNQEKKTTRKVNGQEKSVDTAAAPAQKDSVAAKNTEPQKSSLTSVDQKPTVESTQPSKTPAKQDQSEVKPVDKKAAQQTAPKQERPEQKDNTKSIKAAAKQELADVEDVKTAKLEKTTPKIEEPEPIPIEPTGKRPAEERAVKPTIQVESKPQDIADQGTKAATNNAAVGQRVFNTLKVCWLRFPRD